MFSLHAFIKGFSETLTLRVPGIRTYYPYGFAEESMTQLFEKFGLDVKKALVTLSPDISHDDHENEQPEDELQGEEEHVRSE